MVDLRTLREGGQGILPVCRLGFELDGMLAFQLTFDMPQITIRFVFSLANPSDRHRIWNFLFDVGNFGLLSLQISPFLSL